MISRRTIWLPRLLPFFLLAGGCATPYEARQRDQGYSEFRVATDVFSVSFRANTSTPEEEVDKYLLRRAAELTLDNGFRFYIVLSEKERTRSSSIGYSAVKIPLVAPAASIWIRCYADRPSAHDLAIDAELFLRFNYPESLKLRSATGTPAEG